MQPSSPDIRSTGERFPSTHWSVVFAAAAEESTADQKEALENWCNAYYEPIYGFARRLGHSPHDALDLTQGFFAHLLRSQLLSRTDPQHGRLRTFLLKSFRHFASNERVKATAKKRGGGQRLLSLDLTDLEHRYHESPCDSDTPEKLYERRWAMSVLEQALARVGASYRKSGRGEAFEALEGMLTGAAPEENYGELAVRLGIKEGAVKTAIHRLRIRFKDALHQTVADTIMDSSQVEEEIRYLKSVMTSQ